MVELRMLTAWSPVWATTAWCPDEARATTSALLCTVWSQGMARVAMSELLMFTAWSPVWATTVTAWCPKEARVVLRPRCYASFELCCTPLGCGARRGLGQPHQHWYARCGA